MFDDVESMIFFFKVRKKNEELRLVAEKKRFEEEQKNKKIEEEYQAELRQQAEMRLEHHNHQEIFVRKNRLWIKTKAI